MRSTVRLLALIMLPTLVLSACDIGLTGPINLFGGGVPPEQSVIITGFVFTANDSSAITNASVELLYIDAQRYKNLLGRDTTDSSGRYEIKWLMKSAAWNDLWGISYYWNLEASANGFATQRITSADSNRVVCIRGTQVRDFYLQRISP